MVVLVADGYDDFTTFTSPVISLSSNSTFDIKIQFFTLHKQMLGFTLIILLLQQTLRNVP